jgi:hypothetical protein
MNTISGYYTIQNGAPPLKVIVNLKAKVGVKIGCIY